VGLKISPRFRVAFGFAELGLMFSWDFSAVGIVALSSPLFSFDGSTSNFMDGIVPTDGWVEISSVSSLFFLLLRHPKQYF
jgi:hypothetical protein